MKKINHNFLELRKIFEHYWDNSTKYEKTTILPGDSISKGQCGVTSAFLGNALEAMGFEIYFCEGNVFFGDNTSPIINHCWLKVLKNQEILIDLTIDQTGFSEKIICEYLPEKLGIFYKERKSIPLSQITSKNLLKRLKTFKENLKNRKRLKIIFEEL